MPRPFFPSPHLRLSILTLLQFSTRSPINHLSLLQNQSFNFFSALSESTTGSSLTLDYLINSCGLSPETALFTSTKLTLKNISGPDSVLEFFKRHNFSKTQISNLIAYQPRFLLSKVDKTLEPKMKAIKDFGISDSDIPGLVAQNPKLLIRGLNTEILPSLKFIKEFVRTEENVIKALKKSKWLLTSDLRKRMLPNIATMKEYGLCESRIAYIIMTQPRFLMQKPSSLPKYIDRVAELGFEPGSGMAVLAIFALSFMSKSTWDAKFELLKSLGWSEEEIIDGFRRMPNFMLCSEKKMKSGMDFFANRLKFSPSFISSHPKLLMFSMKKRVIPRSRVWWILRSKDVVKGKEELIHMLNLTEDDFLTRYVNKYADLVPYLLKAYNRELDFGWLDSDKVTEVSLTELFADEK